MPSLVGSEMCIRDRPITGRFVNTVTRGWVGAPNGRAPFRFHGAVVGSVARRLSRTRNLAASNKHLAEFFSGRSWAQELFFSGFLKSLKLFFRRFVPIVSGTEFFSRVSLKFELFMEKKGSHCHRSYTGDNGNAIFQIYLPKIFKKYFGRRYARTPAM